MTKGLQMSEVTKYYAEGSNRIAALGHVSISVEPGNLLLLLDRRALVKAPFCLSLEHCSKLQKERLS